MIRLVRRALAHDRDGGVALVMVIGVTAMLTILLVAGIAVAMGSQRNARTTQDWSAALAAAYAGVEEYQSRLADDTTYHQYGNPAAVFGKPTPAEVEDGLGQRTLPTGAATNPAFGLGTGGTWATVPGSGGAAEFRYEVDNTRYSLDGTLRIRSTGRAGGETRSIVADLRQQGFIDFLYFTDYEIQDPDLSGDPEACEQQWWAGRKTYSGSSWNRCAEIAFGSSDVLDGPVHSNDTLRVCNADFLGVVTTASPVINQSSGVVVIDPATGQPALTGNRFLRRDSTGATCSGETFGQGLPVYNPALAMPPTNADLRREVRSDLGAEVPRPGCLYTGPTTIVFNSNGTMTVRSPWTKKTRVAGEPTPTSGTAPSECGTPGTSGLGSATGQTIDVPTNNVIFVQSVPSLTTDPNYWSSSSQPSGLSSDQLSQGGNGIGYPLKSGSYWEAKPYGASAMSQAYGVRNGDAFVKGNLKGNVTVSAENYIYVTGDIRYVDSQRDMLGLVGQNAVFVWNPARSTGGSGYATMLSDSGRRIDAAILSVAHTFMVQNYERGSGRGTLTINGAIAQKFRGTVRGGSYGYAKDYNYDERFRRTAPPKFLSPVNTSYGVNVWIEVQPAFDPDGAVASP